MRRLIPQPVLAIVAEYASSAETHATLDSLFIYAGCPGDPPAGSKAAKALEWLRVVNKDESLLPLEVLGRILEGYMDKPLAAGDWDFDGLTAFRAKVGKALASSNLQYRQGGVVTDALAAPTRTLESFIRSRDLKSLSEEFERAASKADTEPREAVSAAANILESICKHYIDERGLQMPAKQVLGDLWCWRRPKFDPPVRALPTQI